jgi:hypothetical protein
LLRSCSNGNRAEMEGMCELLHTGDVFWPSNVEPHREGPMVRIHLPPAESRQRTVLPPQAIGCTAPPAVVRRKISRRAHGATRPPGYDARYSVILVPIFVRRCSPLPYVPSPVFLLFAAFNRSALRCSSDSGDGLSGLRQAVNSETLNISDCGKRPAGLHSLTRCWWATRLSIVCRC